MATFGGFGRSPELSETSETLWSVEKTSTFVKISTCNLQQTKNFLYYKLRDWKWSKNKFEAEVLAVIYRIRVSWAMVWMRSAWVN